MDEYAGPERRQEPAVQIAFERAVSVAAAQAAQRVAKVHRRRLVTQAFIAAFVGASAIWVIALIVVRNDVKTFAHKNAIYDCTLFEQAAAKVGDFVQSDADLRAAQNQQGLGRELSADLQKIIKRTTLLSLARSQQAQVTAAVKRWDRDAMELRHLAGTDCAAHLGG